MQSEPDEKALALFITFDQTIQRPNRHRDINYNHTKELKMCFTPLRRAINFERGR
jgi:hypothetical protein